MTELQEMFLFGTFIYYLFKGSLFVVLYIALVIVEKHAREQQKQIQAYLRKKAIERRKVAVKLMFVRTAN